MKYMELPEHKTKFVSRTEQEKKTSAELKEIPPLYDYVGTRTDKKSNEKRNPQIKK